MLAFNRIKLLAIFAFAIFLISSCQQNKKDGNKENEPVILIKTDLGDMKVKLYNETPIHRDNFLKLVKDGFYDGVIFHRVIFDFMIQGGDPDTKNELEEGKVYGSTDTGYDLPAEFRKNLFHKKGALAAAREGDNENPEKKSSGSQFYIVQGRKFTEGELSALAKRKNDNLRKSILDKLVMEKADELLDKGINPDFSQLPETLSDTLDQIISKIDPYGYTPEMVEVYSTVGGTPHLDGDYTVFGEVIEGFEVIDKIAASITDLNDRPVKSIKMKMKIISE